MRILVVEDSFIAARTIGDVLEAAGHQAILAASADQAFRAVALGVPELAIVDLALSDGLTGPRLARALAAQRIPVVVCTGYGPDHARRLLHGVSVAAILGKPVRPEELLAAVRSAPARPR